MSRLEIRGVIVPSDFDDDWYGDYIDRGVITPESRFRSALDAADIAAPLDIYVNSPGGSVFAANEMANAVNTWKLVNAQPVTVTVGAMAASAASAFSISVADKINAHSNAKMMFHGAYTGTVGGAEAHADGAELLAMINADVMTKLVSRYEVDADLVSEWFAEGREGWLNADDMAAAGIAQSIIGEPADVIDFDTDEIHTIENHGLSIAAFAKIAPPEDTEEEDGREAADDTADAPKAGDPAPDAELALDEDNPWFRGGYEAGRAAANTEAAPGITILNEHITALTEESRGYQSERDKLTAELAKLVSDSTATIQNLTINLGDANDRHAKLTAGSLEFSTEALSWEEALAQHDGDYVLARKAFPQLAHDYDRINGRK